MKTRTLLSTVLVSSVVAALSISASAQAGTVTPGGDASTGSDLRCSTGGIGATLRVATSNTTGLVWQITSIQFWNGSVFVHYAWSNYRKAPVTAGGSTQLSWVDANTGAYVYGLESYSVPVGAYSSGAVRLRRWRLDLPHPHRARPGRYRLEQLLLQLTDAASAAVRSEERQRCAAWRMGEPGERSGGKGEERKDATVMAPSPGLDTVRCPGGEIRQIVKGEPDV